MKQLVIIGAAIFLYSNSNAQVGNILKRKAGEGAKQGTEVAVEKAFDKILNGKRNKSSKQEDSKTPSGETKIQGSTNATSSGADTGREQSIKTYSKYDFIPGEKIIAYDDFLQEAVGDFPVRWTTNASGEIMTVDNYSGHFLNISKEGIYMPKFIKSLPENFTLEYDILFIPPAMPDGPNTAVVGTQFITMPDSKKPFEYFADKVYFELDPYMNNVNIGSYTKTGEKILENQFNVKGVQRNRVFNYHVSVWRQKTRLRVYLNETKVIDAPSLFVEDIKYNAMRFATSLNNDGSTWLINNFKFASGLPDTRNKLVTEGKFSTTGILFEINEAMIKASSYGTLKDIASVLKENGSLHVKIVGYTDSDGNDVTNLELSKKRAEAVKNILVTEFGMDESRLQTEGKGETQPVAPNTTPEGKAQNRRVEFIKI